MSRLVDYEGTEHEFPDDFSDQDVSRALSTYDRNKKIETFKQNMSRSLSGLASQGASDVSGGILTGISNAAELLPTTNKLINPFVYRLITGKSLPEEKTDFYKMMGTEEKPFYTPGGAMQLLGEMAIPIKTLPKAPNLAKGGINIIKKGIESISPQKTSTELMEHISGGLPHTQASTESIANSLRNSYESNLQQSLSHLNFPLEQAGKELIYEHIDPLISTKIDKSKNLIDKMKDFNIGELFNRFKKDPTLQNAHDLKSELGDMIGDLKRSPKMTPSERIELQNLRQARNKLKSDIENFLSHRDSQSNQSLLPQYKIGTELYKENVSPYLSSKKLREIVKQGKTSVKNIQDIFKSPFDIIDKLSGNKKIGPVNKILSDLPTETKNKILFNAIGGRTNIKDPKKLLELLEKSEQKGYAHLLSSDTKKLITELKNRINKKSQLKSVAKYTGAGTGALIGEEILRNIFSGKK